MDLPDMLEFTAANKDEGPVLVASDAIVGIVGVDNSKESRVDYPERFTRLFLGPGSICVTETPGQVLEMLVAE